MPEVKPPRPQPGSVKTFERRIKICAHCGYLLRDTGLCADGCSFDCEPRTANDFFYAVYAITETFLRDERPER